MGILNNKKILITGGSLGIGFEISRLCASEGAQLILIARNQEDLESSIEKLGNNKAKHKFYSLDVSNPKAVKKLAEKMKAESQYLDGLVNCAGIYGPIGRSDKIDPIEFTHAININLLGTFYMCHYFLPIIRRKTRGKIINFSGGGAAGPFPNFTSYAVSKVGVVRLSENLAYEFKKDKIDINSIAPGFVVTRLHQDTIEAGEKAGVDFLNNTLNQIKTGGVPAEKAAKLTLYLLSPDSDGITGKFISAPWDPWEEESFQTKLKLEKDFATLRRIDEKFFYMKG